MSLVAGFEIVVGRIGQVADILFSAGLSCDNFVRKTNTFIAFFPLVFTDFAVDVGPVGRVSDVLCYVGLSFRVRTLKYVTDFKLLCSSLLALQRLTGNAHHAITLLQVRVPRWCSWCAM